MDNDVKLSILHFLDILYKCLKKGEKFNLDLVGPRFFMFGVEEWFHIFSYLSYKEFITGFCTHNTKDGELFDIENLMITPKGIEYLLDEEEKYIEEVRKKESILSIYFKE